MYIAHINDRYWLKRMPGTGRRHAVGCSSWEIPEEFSGRSDLVGSAIHYTEDEVKLRLGFPLSHRGRRDKEKVEQANAEKPTAKGKIDDARLTLRSLLHYLWDEAGLTTWSADCLPRNWAFAYDSLSMAAARKTVKHAELQRYLYLPRPCDKQRVAQIEGERRQRFAQVSGTDDKKVHHLLVMVGAVESIKLSGENYRATFTDMPNYPIVIKPDLYGKMLKNLGKEMRMCQADSTGQMIMIGTFCVEVEGTAVFEEVALMYVNEDWIPYENIYDRDLIEKLQKDKRSFLRLLRYNRPTATPMPTLLLTDQGDAPLSIYVLDAEASTTAKQIEDSAIASKYEYIVWNPKVDGEIPALPPIQLRSNSSQAVTLPGDQQSEAEAASHPFSSAKTTEGSSLESSLAEIPAEGVSA